ncbi:MAG: type II secretion system protein GspK [Bdellovibrionota bacterium]
MTRAPSPSIDEQSGFALLLTVFVIALATILIMDFAEDVEAFQRSARGYSEQVQATLMLKSALNLGRLLVEAPKPEDTKDQDWLYEAWNNIGAVPSIPLEGLMGELRIMIVDEDGKIDINAIQGPGVGTPGFGTPPIGASNPTGGAGGAAPLLDNPSFWRNALKELFTRQGFVREQFQPDAHRTLGNVGYEAGDQVAIISDFIDRDSESFHAPTFEGDGIEGGSNKAWFFNRPIRTVAELANVPGMTLERLQQIAPYVRVSQSITGVGNSINVNTAPLEVLLALGIPDSQAQEIAQRRLSFPFTKQILSTLVAGDPNLANRLKVNSSEFSVIARVIMPTRTFWLRATLAVQQSGANARKAITRSMEFY